jgi:uncharacterized protein YbgA (DUF1722 family)
MAQEVLTMMEDTVNRLKKTIMTKRFVNCYSKAFSPENKQELDQSLSTLKEEYKNIYVDIDIQGFKDCEDEEQEANALLALINRELTGKGPATSPIQAISIANAIHKWSNTLDSQALLVFYFFHDLYSENEKNVLRSLRKALRDRDEISSYLGILLVSNRKISRWELFPESNLDDRHLTLFEFDGLEVN